MILLVGLLASPDSAAAQRTTSFGETQRDITFFVGADPQYIPWAFPPSCQDNALVECASEINMWAIETYAGMPDPWDGEPWSPVRGIMLTGDLVQNGGKFQEKNCFQDNWTWDDGTPSMLYPPVFEGLGNHDVGPNGHTPNPSLGEAPWEDHDSPMVDLVDSRNEDREQIQLDEGGWAPLEDYNYAPGEGHYAWTWDGVRFIQLNEYAGGTVIGTDRWVYARNSLEFLACDLETHVGTSGMPVVLFQHYGVDAPSTAADASWTADERAAFHEVLDDYNVIALFTGHAHYGQPFCMAWDGDKTIVAGSAAPCWTAGHGLPDDIPVFSVNTCGGGAAPPTNGSSVECWNGPTSGEALPRTFGFLLVRILGDELRVASWDISRPDMDALIANQVPSGPGWHFPDHHKIQLDLSGLPAMTPPGLGCGEVARYCPEAESASSGDAQHILDAIEEGACGHGAAKVNLGEGSYTITDGSLLLDEAVLLRAQGGPAQIQ